MVTEKNRALYEEAKRYMPGGACAGGRSNRIFGMPLYLDHADRFPNDKNRGNFVQ